MCSFFFLHHTSASNNFSFAPFVATYFKMLQVSLIIFELIDDVLLLFLQHNTVRLLLLCSLCFRKLANPSLKFFWGNALSLTLILGCEDEKMEEKENVERNYICID